MPKNSKQNSQINQILLKNSLINCYPCLEEYLEVIEILRNIQKDQATQIDDIKNKMPINRKNSNYEHASEWLKTLNGITTGINMSLKNYNDLETKFKNENIE
ncbi:30565_t:CDS:2, partial [Racocetra persica]